MTTTESDETVSTGLDRALKVIFAAASSAQQDIGVTELSRATGLSKAVVHRIVRTLVARDFFAYNERTQRYRLGSGAITVGLAALESLDVPRLARPHLESLVAETDETATLSARVADHRLYVDQVLSPQEIRMSVQLGVHFPLYAGGSSKAILAALPEEEVRRVLQRLESTAGTGAAPIAPEVLGAELDTIRARGYAASHSERQSGAASVACAIRRSDGSVFGSISVCGPVDRFGDPEVERYGELIQVAGADISQELGFSGSIYVAP